MKGIKWLERHLGEQYKIHVMAFKNYSPMHIDATMSMIGPGIVIVNADRPCEPDSQLDIFRKAGVSSIFVLSN